MKDVKEKLLSPWLLSFIIFKGFSWRTILNLSNAPKNKLSKGLFLHKPHVFFVFANFFPQDITMCSLSPPRLEYIASNI